MTPKIFLSILLLLVGGLNAAAQTGTVRAVVADRTTREPIIGAIAELERNGGSTARVYATSNVDGILSSRLSYGRYGVAVTSLGYDSLRTEFQLAGRALLLDTLWLSPRVERIDNVVVEVPALRSSIRGDTLSYRASAYKVAFGSDAEALLSKMPGLEVAQGAISAQGRNVQKVYVDGREFFGNDVMSAIRNLPSDMIESIDVYNTQSDQSEFTGVDNGEGYTALNIVTQPDKRRGAFGRLYAAYGIPDKYIGGGNVNVFNQERRISVVGMVNNISRQNFSFEDILGTTDDASDKSRNNNFMVRPLDGISTVQAVGVNYSDNWGKGAKISASYFFNRTDNHNLSQSEKQTFTQSDKLVLYGDQAATQTLNDNHRFTSRIDWKLNDRHSMMMRTSLSSQGNDSQGDVRSRTDNKFSDDDIRFVYRRRNFSDNSSSGLNFSNNLTYRYRIPAARWQNLTFGVGGAYRSYDLLSAPRQYVFRDPGDISFDTLDYSSRSLSRTDRTQPGYDVNGSGTYTRSLSKRSRMSLEYRLNYTSNSIERNTYLFDNQTSAFNPARDPRQSTDYHYNYLTHRAGASYQYSFKKTKIAATLYYQQVHFRSDYLFPFEKRSDASFGNLTYNLTSTIHLNRDNMLKFDASARTVNPRAADLQDIVNKTNPQNVFAGNPSLEPVYTHRMAGQYIRSNARKGRTFTLAAEFSASANTIADSLVIDTPEFVIPDGEGGVLGEGNQFIKPVNTPGFWNFRSSVNYGFPVKWLRSNLNLRAGISTGRMPSIINGVNNELANSSYHGGLTLGSNISENIDFRVAYTGRYNTSKSESKVRTLDNTYFSQSLRAEATFVVWTRLILRGNVDYDYYRGITDTFLEKRTICNALVGLKVFRSRLGEISVGINDILNQNGTTFRRTVSGTTIRNVINQAIGRYVSFQFTYNLRIYRRQSSAVLDHLKFESPKSN